MSIHVPIHMSIHMSIRMVCVGAYTETLVEIVARRLAIVEMKTVPARMDMWNGHGIHGHRHGRRLEDRHGHGHVHRRVRRQAHRCV